MASADTRKKFWTKAVYRGSQVLFGERAHLVDVLRSVKAAKLPRKRKQAEVRLLKKLIETRTKELNRITPRWDHVFKKVRDPNTSAQELLRLARSLSQDDFLIARGLTEHREASPELLVLYASHPYASVRENVARHPHTPTNVLEAMAEDSREPLWFLVACNPSTPQDLRQRLRERMQEAAPTEG